MKKTILIPALSAVLSISVLSGCNMGEYGTADRAPENEPENVNYYRTGFRGDQINNAEDQGGRADFSVFPRGRDFADAQVEERRYEFNLFDEQQREQGQQFFGRQQREQGHQQQEQQQPEQEQQREQQQPEQEQQQQQEQPEQEQQTPAEQQREQNADQGQADKPSGMNQFEQQVVELTNQERQNNGLNPLKPHGELADVAETKSEDMSDNGYFSHDSPTYGSPFEMIKDSGIEYQSAAENIAAGQQSPEQVVNAWMNSEGHRKNIMNPNLTHIGVGFDEDGNYWTQMFIKK